jgi:8-oxo-dGTP pyrophosphatase MutT (NUDIX family)
MPDTPVPAAGFLLYRDTPEGRRWLLLRNSKRGDWGFPKGHADADEDLLDTARRECIEETGIDRVTVTGAREHISYPTERGLKTVTYFPAVTDQEQVTVSKEHSKAVWLDTGQAADRLDHPNLRSLFLVVAERLAGSC